MSCRRLRAERAIRPAGSVLAWLLVLFAGQTACSTPWAGSPEFSQNTPVPAPGLAGRLLFTRGAGLWTLSLRDGQMVQMVPPPELGQVAGARWSPDGFRMAYAVLQLRDRRIPVSEVTIASSDGSDARTLLAAEGPGAFYQAPVWAPSGTHLYVVHTAQTAGERIRRIERVDISTGEREIVIDEPGQFDVSPDGRWLALVRASGSSASVVLLDLETGGQRALVPEGRFHLIAAPRFDPSSQTLVFSAAPSGSASLIPIPPVGLAAGSLLKPATARAHGPAQDLYAVSVGGGPLSRIAAVGADDPVAAWSPDGAHLAVLWFESLSAIPVAGGTPTPILTPGGSGSVDWAR